MFINIDGTEHVLDFEYLDKGAKPYTTVATLKVVNEKVVENGKIINFKATQIGNGAAVCAVNDTFVKSVGREIALERLLTAMNFDKDTKRSIRCQVFSVMKHSTKDQHPE
jgi:hypothetical protein